MTVPATARLALGTAQFGQDYGISNPAGRVAQDEVQRILRQATKAGIDTIDTAIAYGDSEAALGEAGVGNWRIVTKLPAVPEDCPDVATWVTGQITSSRRHLGVKRLYGVLLHRPDQLQSRLGPALGDALQQLKQTGMTQKIGVSIYGPDQLERLIGAYPVDLVQAPLNILDQRLVTSGWTERLHRQGIEIHARSLFLQGLLLMAPTERPAQFAGFGAVWSCWSAWLRRHQLTPLQACLGYAVGVAGLDRLVVGVTSSAQLVEIQAACDVRLPDLPRWPDPLDERLITPSLWREL